MTSQENVSAVPGAPAAGSVPALQFPVRDTGQGGGPGGTARCSWDGGYPAAARALADRRGVPVTAVYEAAFALLLHRYSGQDELVYARCGGADTAGAAGRPGAVRSTLPGGATFSSLLAAPPAAVDAGTGLGGGLRAGFAAGGPPDEPAGLDLLLAVDADRAGFRLVYEQRLFAPEFIARLAANLATLLADACARPDEDVRVLALLSDAERDYLLHEVNATDRDFPRDATVHGLVRAQAARTPDAPAVEWDGTVMTYRQLDESANRLARALAASGVTAGDRVGVSVARTHRTVCLLLAVHKLGCGYAPLDPAYPADRLSAIAATAGMSAVVHDRAEAPAWLAGQDARALPLAQLWEKAEAERCDDLGTAVPPTATTHLIYTSGSTGLPKGVVITHRNVVALLRWAWDTYQEADVARVLFGTSLNFDLSVFEMWCPLTTGGTVVVVDNALALTENPALAPTLVNTVPSVFGVLLQRDAVPASARVLNIAGEPLSGELVNAAFAGSAAERIYNLYGPSEDTTYSTSKCLTGPVSANPTIGVPICNTRAYLLDARGQLVPRGVPGEVYLGGEGVSAGYINDPERTDAAFVPAPPSLPGAGRLYRTGDLARWTEDGELSCMGRKDNQVKIRGYRIELGEIESVLRALVGIGDVAALAVRHAGDLRLVAYVADPDGGLTEERAGDHLRGALPHYMQPARIVVEPRLPRLPNGKVDRKTLAARDVDWGETAAEGPALTDPTEAEVGAVWTDLLGIACPRADLDFFSVGGHSLLANLLAARLTGLAGTQVRVAQVYENRTLAQQARLITRKRAEEPGGAGHARGAGLPDVHETLRESIGGHGVPGSGVALYAGGTLEFAYQGHADQEAGVPYTAASRQRMTCITKVLVACVALIMVDRGLIPLDEPLGDLLPNAFVRQGGERVEVTLRQLLSHTSGLDDSHEVWNRVDQPDLEAYIDSFRGYRQLFEPGTIFAYSACATSIVALLIQKVMGMPWRRALNEMLLTPLGIKEVPETNEPGDHYGDDVAAGYLWSATEQRYAPFTPGPQTVADDAASSFAVCFTVEDLAALGLFALNDGVAPSGERLLSEDLARQMRSPQADVPGHHFMHAWGLGWLLFGPTAFGFNSNGSGHHNFIQIFPETRSFLILLANAYPAFGVYEDLVQTFAGVGLVRSGRPFELDLDDCAGLYESDGYRLNVLPGTDRLRYEYCERAEDGSWLELDQGDLVLSGAGGFSSMSDRNILAGSISFVPVTGSRVPTFVRMGQRVARKVAGSS